MCIHNESASERYMNWLSFCRAAKLPLTTGQKNGRNGESHNPNYGVEPDASPVLTVIYRPGEEVQINHRTGKVSVTTSSRRRRKKR